MTNRLFLILCIAPSILLAGCGKTEDDRREKLFLNRFSKAIKNKNSCEAYRIAAGRFMYIPPPNENKRKLNARMRKWKDRIDESAIACKKDKWPQVKANIEAELETLNRLSSLNNVTATYIGDSLRLDSLNRNCKVDFYIHNPSEFQVVSLRGYWQRMGNHREHFEYKSQKYRVERNIAISIEPIEIPIGLDPILPGNKKNAAKCNFAIAEEIQRNGGTNVEMKIREIGILLDGKEKSFSLVEMNNRIAEIERILKAGYQAINLPDLEDYSILSR